MPKRLTHIQFVKRVWHLVGDEYSVHSEYVNSARKVTFKHVCGNNFSMSPNNFCILGQRCPSCATSLRNLKLTKTHDEIVRGIKEIHGDEYTVLEIYKHNKIPFLVRHEKCGNVYKAWSYGILSGDGCKKCSDKNNGLKRRKTQKQFEDEVLLKTKGEYVVVGQYIKDYIHVEVRHTICNQIYSTSPTNLLQGYGCPYCRESKGEKAVRSILNKKQLNFESQYTYEDLLGRNGHPLRFDFAVVDHDESVLYLIEYDGEYHYLPIVSQWRLDYQKDHDKRKDEYCKNKNIKLLRIPYWDIDKAEDIVNEFHSNILIKRGMLS